MNDWEDVPRDPLADDEQLQEIWDRIQPKPAIPRSWWYRWWPKLAVLGGVLLFWGMFWWEATR